MGATPKGSAGWVVQGMWALGLYIGAGPRTFSATSSPSATSVYPESHRPQNEQQ